MLSYNIKEMIIIMIVNNVQNSDAFKSYEKYEILTEHYYFV